MSLFSFLGGLASGLFGASSQSKANETNLQIARETNEANAKLAQENRDFELEMWNKANAYNSPLQQMQRLREANLNPNLVYGSSSVTGNLSTSTPNVPTPVMQAARVDPVQNPIQIAINTMLAMEANQAQVEALKLKNDEQSLTNEFLRYTLPGRKTRSDVDDQYYEEFIRSRNQNSVANAGMASENWHMTVQKRALEDILYENGYYEQLKDYQLQFLEEQVGSLVLSNDIKEYDKEIRRLDAFFYKEFGIKPQDPAYMKIIMQIANRLLGRTSESGLGVVDWMLDKIGF